MHVITTCILSYFTLINDDKFLKSVSALPFKESSGFDNISLKIIKIATPHIMKPLSQLLIKVSHWLFAIMDRDC